MKPKSFYVIEAIRPDGKSWYPRRFIYIQYETGDFGGPDRTIQVSHDYGVADAYTNLGSARYGMRDIKAIESKLVMKIRKFTEVID